VQYFTSDNALKKSKIVFLFSLFGILAALPGNAQIRELQSMWEEQQDTSRFGWGTLKYLEITDQEFMKLYDAQPSFGMFHDNYLITGVPTNKEISN
jgi:phospholipase A1